MSWLKFHKGETNIATNGMKMTIIACRNNADLDVQFEDGYIAVHKTYYNFKKGNIKNPNAVDAVNASYIGKKMMAKNGLMMEVIAYRGSMDIDVRFEDGYIAEHRKYSNFLTGEIKHPFPFQIDDMVVEKFAYRYMDTNNFYCRCSKCKLPDILAISEIGGHVCPR